MARSLGDWRFEFSAEKGYEELSHKWAWFVGLGAFMVVVGFVAMSSAFVATMATVTMLGVLIGAGGIAQIVHAFSARKWTGVVFELMLGVLALVVGVLMAANPMMGAVTATMVLSSFYLVSGIFRIATALVNKFPHRGWMVFNGIVSAGLGLMIWAQIPTASLFIIGLFVGIDLVMTGASYAAFGMHLHRDETAHHHAAHA